MTEEQKKLLLEIRWLGYYALDMYDEACDVWDETSDGYKSIYDKLYELEDTLKAIFCKDEANDKS